MSTTGRACRHCTTLVIDVHDEPVAGIPYTVDTHPVSWPEALRAVATGLAVVIVQNSRHGQHVHRLDAGRIAQGPRPRDDYHVQHQCATPAARAPAPAPRPAPHDHGPGY